MNDVFTISTPVQIALGILFLGMLLALTRLIKGPSVPDRIIALDVLATLTLGTFVVYAIGANQVMFIDVAISIALISFLSTVAFARYLARKISK